MVQFLRDNNMFDAPQEKVERKATWQRVKATCAKYEDQARGVGSRSLGDARLFRRSRIDF